MKLTPEQTAIIAVAQSTKDNLMVRALAGSGKTSTIVHIAGALPHVDILCLAFNKSIATEMAERLPAHCTSSTFNALGHRAWANEIDKRIFINRNKMFEILSDYMNQVPEDEVSYLRPQFTHILHTLNEAKHLGYVPSPETYTKATSLITTEAFFESTEYILNHSAQRAVNACIRTSIEQAYQGTLDFNDQIYMPALFPCHFDIFGLVIVDEAQDLSAINHKMLEKLARYRIIAVGDPAQAIYGFRGAHTDSMDRLQDKFFMRELPLTISFRCPKAIVQHVQWRVPDMRAWEGNPEQGSIAHWAEWSVHDIPSSAAILCRNNAPLYAIALTMLANGIRPNLGGRSIVGGLRTIMRKLGPSHMSRTESLDALNDWEEEQLSKRRSKGTVHDQGQCIRAILRQCDTLGDALELLYTLENSRGNIQLLTGHRAKGLEFSDVFFLDEELVGEEEQDPNVRYVICTRALSTLTYIDSNSCTERF